MHPCSRVAPKWRAVNCGVMGYGSVPSRARFERDAARVCNRSALTKRESTESMRPCRSFNNESYRMKVECRQCKSGVIRDSGAIESLALVAQGGLAETVRMRRANIRCGLACSHRRDHCQRSRRL